VLAVLIGKDVRLSKDVGLYDKGQQKLYIIFTPAKHLGRSQGVEWEPEKVTGQLNSGSNMTETPKTCERVKRRTETRGEQHGTRIPTG
jgi:hypothetical protein